MPIADVMGMRVMQEYVSKLDEVAGTFAWAAPELLLGRRCSEKVDIFAFGVVGLLPPFSPAERAMVTLMPWLHSCSMLASSCVCVRCR